MSVNIKDDKLQEVINYYMANGEHDTCDHYGFNVETMSRYLREAKLRKIEGKDTNKVMREIRELYTDDELKAIAKGGRIMPGMARVPIVDFDGKRIRIGHITDSHIGSSYFNKDRMFQAFEEFEKEGVDFITHSGDVSEGMSNRPGHIYELSQLGYSQQKDECVDVFSQWTSSDIYAIDGNHDQWFIKSNGAKIVDDIAKEVDNFHFIGHDEGDISLKGKATLKLWHGGDGNSYALSYRLQKILESMSGGEKPNVLIAGHVHKYVSIFERNVYAISVGTRQRQTQWMRGKRISAHVGFVIADYWVNKNGLAKMSHTWYPFYT
jgi:predicted phosphodiesterase